MSLPVPPHLQSTVEVLKRAFPLGMGDAEYRALLVALDQDYCDEHLALVVAAVTGREPVVVDNDHADAVGRRRPDPAFVADIRRRLKAAGYEDVADVAAGD